MDFFRWFRRTTTSGVPVPRPDVPVARLFENQKRAMRGRQLTDEALSHQTLGNASKALSLVNEAISECGYAPAMTVKAKLLIDTNEVQAADRWIRECLVRLADTSANYLDTYCRDALRIELHEELGVVHFTKYGNFQDGLRFLNAGLTLVEQCEEALLLWSDSAPGALRSSIFQKLGQLYALEGIPDKAISYCSARLRHTPDCSQCEQVLALMAGLEPRPHNLQDVVNILTHKLTELRHPQALMMGDAAMAAHVYSSTVPVAFAWICMQHRTKSRNFLSGTEVSLLSERAVLALAGARRRAADAMNTMMQRGFELHRGRRNPDVSISLDSRSLSKSCMAELTDVMQSIPVDDLFEANAMALVCLENWISKRLNLSKNQGQELISSLPTNPPGKRPD